MQLLNGDILNEQIEFLLWLWQVQPSANVAVIVSAKTVASQLAQKLRYIAWSLLQLNYFCISCWASAKLIVFIRLVKVVIWPLWPFYCRYGES